jgi:hypothetical protein
MAGLWEAGFAKLASVSVDMKTVQANTIYTVPADKELWVAFVLVRGPSASLAGGTDYDFSNWRQTVDLSSITSSTRYILLDGNNAAYVRLGATSDFQLTVVTGSTAAATATVELYGILLPA